MGTMQRMDYKEFASKFGNILRDMNPATRRSYKRRGVVPDKIVAALQKSVAEPLQTSPATLQPVTPATPPKEVVPVPDDLPGDMPDKVVIPTGEVGHPEFDIMADGWARGFPSDEGHLRTYRTAHAIRRFAEKRGEESRAKALTTEFWAKYAGAAESRVAFFKKLAGAK